MKKKNVTFDLKSTACIIEVNDQPAFYGNNVTFGLDAHIQLVT